MFFPHIIILHRRENEKPMSATSADPQMLHTHPAFHTPTTDSDNSCHPPGLRRGSAYFDIRRGHENLISFTSPHSMICAHAPAVIAAAALVPVMVTKRFRSPGPYTFTAGAQKSGFTSPESVNPLPESRYRPPFATL